MRKAILMIPLALSAFAAQAQENPIAALSPDDEVSVMQSIHVANDRVAQPWVLPTYEPYGRGFQRAIQRAIAEERSLAAKLIALEKNSGTTGPWLSSNRFLGCEHETLSVNAWLASQHKDSTKDHEEKNRGVGLVYSCNGWSASADELINSNRGKARVLSLVWGMRLIEVGPIFINGSVGYARVSYGVPRYNVTLYETSPIGYVGVGLVQYPKFTFNLAPVPETAGKAIIAWVKYEVVRFK
jgi:hypothetical protein